MDGPWVDGCGGHSGTHNPMILSQHLSRSFWSTSWLLGQVRNLENVREDFPLREFAVYLERKSQGHSEGVSCGAKLLCCYGTLEERDRCYIQGKNRRTREGNRDREVEQEAARGTLRP